MMFEHVERFRCSSGSDMCGTKLGDSIVLDSGFDEEVDGSQSFTGDGYAAVSLQKFLVHI